MGGLYVTNILKLNIMKKICRNCHFLSKEIPEPNTGRHLAFTLSQWERDDFKKGNFNKINDNFSLRCHIGVWDEGAASIKDKREAIINKINREDKCFFYPYMPGMLFNPAEILQKRSQENKELKKHTYLP